MSKASMRKMTMRITAVFVAALFSGCAAQPDSTENDVFSDFIAVAELEPLDTARFQDQFSTQALTDEYALLQAREDRYLVKFLYRCHELYKDRFPADVRRDRNALRAGVDTIRGCRIDKIFSVDKAQAEELKLLANRLEDG